MDARQDEMMTRFFFENALLPDGWAKNVLTETDGSGWITSVMVNSILDRPDHRAAIAVPGVPNCHSHAFQRAMAGLAEFRSQSVDSFWTWRDLMYRFVDKLTPEDLAAIAAQAYMEMLEAGFTAVAEFHYLHHAPDRRPFDDVGEMSGGIIQAVQQTGIGLTLLPVFYECSGFGSMVPDPAQGRFVNTLHRYGQLIERTLSMMKDLPDAVMGLAPHSLRAVTPEGLNGMLSLPCAGAIHIHIAEQVREVDECLAWYGARPVAWLLDNFPVDECWCLVHATHLDRMEIRQLANSGAVVGLCPITEANLGDGIFEAVSFFDQGGLIGIGSDSNIAIGVADELRLLEYSQRLRDHGRNRLAAEGQSSGRTLFDHALKGGAKAGDRRSGRIEVGYRADFVSLDQDHPDLLSRQGDAWLDGWIFAGGNNVVKDVWVGGRHVVRDGLHFARNGIALEYAKILSRIVTS